METRVSFRYTLNMYLLAALALSIATSARSVASDEPWYNYWGLGLAKTAYPEAIRGQVDDVTARADSSRLSFQLDLYGFYFPLRNERTLLGGLVTILGDFVYYDISTKAGAISQLTLGPSLMHFFNGTVGKGFFARSELGVSKFAYDLKVSEAHDTHSSGLGIGASLGAGYSLPVSDETRLQLLLSFQAKRIQGMSFQSLSSSIGALF